MGGAGTRSGASGAARPQTLSRHATPMTIGHADADQTERIYLRRAAPSGSVLSFLPLHTNNLA